MVNRIIAAGADYINFQDGSLPLDYYKAGVEEAHKAGKAVLIRSYGPILFPKDAAALGAAGLTHSAVVPASIGKGAFLKGRQDDSELDLFAQMDESKAQDLANVLAENKTVLVPNFVMQYPRAYVDVNPAIAPYLTLLPPINGPDFGNGAGENIRVVASPANANYYLARGDLQISEKDSLMLSYTETDDWNNAPASYGFNTPYVSHDNVAVLESFQPDNPQHFSIWV